MDNLTSSWRSGTMRSFESLSSLGAKYCYLNRISPAAFGNSVRAALLKAGHPVGVSVYCKSPIRTIAKFFEAAPSKIEESLSLGASIGGSLANLIHEPEALDDRFCICEECLSDGYHSSLHQLKIVERCFIHGSNLNRQSWGIPLYAGAPKEFRFVDPLYRLWFRSGEPKWKAANGYDWPTSDIPKQAKIFALKLGEQVQELDASVGSRPGDFWTQGVRQGSAAQKFGLVADLLSRSSCTERREKTRLDSYHRNFSAISDDSEKILELRQHEFDVLVASRRIEVYFGAESASWMKDLHAYSDCKLEGHLECKEKLIEMLDRNRFESCSDRVWGQSSRFPALEICRFGICPCRALAAVEAIDYIFSPCHDAEYFSSQAEIAGADLSDSIYLRLGPGLSDMVSVFCRRTTAPVLKEATARPSKTFYGRLAWESLSAGKRLKMVVPRGPIRDIIDSLLEAEFYNVVRQLESSNNPWVIVDLIKNADKFNGSKPLAFVVSRVTGGLRSSYLQYRADPVISDSKALHGDLCSENFKEFFNSLAQSQHSIQTMLFDLRNGTSAGILPDQICGSGAILI